MSRGVHCCLLTREQIQGLRPLHAFVMQNFAGKGQSLRQSLHPQTALLLWTQHADDQPAVQALADPTERRAYDGIILVSEWQRQQYLRRFGLDPQRTLVLRNGIGPAFQGLLRGDTSILSAKSMPPVLAYTSTPFRGLDLLLEAFPRIRRQVAGVRLKVFSSMRVYQMPEDEDQARFGPLYRRCRETEAVEYFGSLPQPELARELRSASVLAYPGTFAETSCIAVLEAMASGCAIVTSDLAALPETTGGFARLVPFDGDRQTYRGRFVKATVDVLTRLAGSGSADAERRLRQQVAHVNAHCTWTVQANHWIRWLARMAPTTTYPR